MAKLIKFVHLVVIFVFLFLVLTDSAIGKPFFLSLLNFLVYVIQNLLPLSLIFISSFYITVLQRFFSCRGDNECADDDLNRFVCNPGYVGKCISGRCFCRPLE
jgi:cytochrome b subunit of formate dehydrogenase